MPCRVWGEHPGRELHQGPVPEGRLRPDLDKPGSWWRGTGRPVGPCLLRADLAVAARPPVYIMKILICWPYLTTIEIALQEGNDL